jgi:GTP-binding protein
MQTEFPTSHLNRIVEAAVTATPPPRAGQHRPRIKFVHQTGKRPPTVRVHGNLVNKVSDSYRRYLSNAIRKAFHLSGVGVRLEFQVTKNPYEGKPNKKNASHRRRRPVPKPALKSKPKRRRV